MSDLSLIGILMILLALAALTALAIGLLWDSAMALRRGAQHRAMARALARKGHPHA